MHISHTELARKWIIEGLDKTGIRVDLKLGDEGGGLREGFSSTFYPARPTTLDSNYKPR